MLLLLFTHFLPSDCAAGGTVSTMDPGARPGQRVHRRGQGCLDRHVRPCCHGDEGGTAGVQGVLRLSLIGTQISEQNQNLVIIIIIVF